MQYIYPAYNHANDIKRYEKCIFISKNVIFHLFNSVYLPIKGPQGATGKLYIDE